MAQTIVLLLPAAIMWPANVNSSLAMTEPTYEEKRRNEKEVRETQRNNDLIFIGLLTLFFHPKSPEGQAFKGSMIAYCIYNHLQRPSVILKDTKAEKADKQTTQTNDEQH